MSTTSTMFEKAARRTHNASFMRTHEQPSSRTENTPGVFAITLTDRKEARNSNNRQRGNSQLNTISATPKVQRLPGVNSSHSNGKIIGSKVGKGKPGLEVHTGGKNVEATVK